MKQILFIAVAILSARAAQAMPVLDCRNGATGAEFHLSVYAAEAPYVTLNAELAGSLESQGARDVVKESRGGKIQFGKNLSFSANTAGGYLSVNPELDGYRIRLVQYRGAAADFLFNPGECRNRGI